MPCSANHDPRYAIQHTLESNAALDNQKRIVLLPDMQEKSEWACIYIRYIQILRKLETAYDQTVHPQKRLDMRKALEACIGRMLEVRHAGCRGNGLGLPAPGQTRGK